MKSELFWIKTLQSEVHALVHAFVKQTA